MENVNQVVVDGQVIRVGEEYRNPKGGFVKITKIKIGLSDEEMKNEYNEYDGDPDLTESNDARIYYEKEGKEDWCRAWYIVECCEKVLN